MLYAGTYEDSLFQIVSTNTKFRIALFNKISDDGVLSLVSLHSTKLDDFSGNLIGCVLLSASGNIDKYYGSLGAMKRFMEDLLKSELYKCVQGYRRFVGQEVIGTTILDTKIYDMDVFNAPNIRNVPSHKIGSVASFNEELHNKDFADIQLETLSKSLCGMDRLREIYDLSWYEYPDGRKKKDYRLITTEEEAEELIEILQDPQWEFISVDTEYSGKDIFWQQAPRTTLYGMSVSWKDDQGVYVVFDSKKTEFLEPEVWAPKIVEAINRSPNKTVVHNAFAEVKIFWNYNVILHIDYDTLLIEHNINIDFRDGGRDLKTLTRYYFDCETVELSGVITGSASGKGRVIPGLIPYFDPEVIELYACSDSDFTRKLIMHQKEVFDINKPTCRLDFEMVEMLALAEYYGAKLDTELLPELRRHNLNDMRTIEALAFKYLKEYGLRYQASMRLSPEDRNPNNIDLVIADPEFREDMRRLFSKKSGKGEVPLTLSADSSQMLYEILGYPIMEYTAKKVASSGAKALEKLMVHRAEVPIEILKDDIQSSIADTEYAKFIPKKDLVLLKKSELESLKYPFALILKTYKKLQKRETGFFKPLTMGSQDGWYYTNTSMISARTGRVTNPIQTLDGDLKNLVKTFSDKYYYIVFDMSQIEFRVMMGISNSLWNRTVEVLEKSGSSEAIAKAKAMKPKALDDIIERLNHPYRDYHREGGSRLVGTTPSKMSSAERKRVKPVHFSVPYGAEAYSVAAPKMIKELTDEGKAKVLADTEAILSRWRNELFPLYDFLERTRDEALIPVPDSELPERLKGSNVGRVRNEIGRTRYFHLDPPLPQNFGEMVSEIMSKTGYNRKSATDIALNKVKDIHYSKIRRESGNFPIQSLARDIFFSGMTRLYRELKQRGFFGQDRDFFKAMMSIFVHDECGIQVHKSVHPYCMFDMIERNCKIQLHGHPTYFMNVAIAESWSEGKSDEYESSLIYLHDRAEKWKDNPEFYEDQAYKIISQKEFIYEDIREHFYHEVISTLVKEMREKKCSLREAVETTEEYYVTGHMEMWCPGVNGARDLTSRAIGCFACYPEFVQECGLSCDELIEGKLLSDWVQGCSEWISENKPNPEKWISESDVIPRADVNDITNYIGSDGQVHNFGDQDGKVHLDFDGTESSELFTTDDALDLNELGLEETDLFGGLAQEEQTIEELELDLGDFEEVGGDDLDRLLSKGDISNDELYKTEYTKFEFTYDKFEDEDILADYSSLFVEDDESYYSMVLMDYVANEVQEETEEKTDKIRPRIIMFRDSVTLDTYGMTENQKAIALDMILQFKNTDGVVLQKIDKGKIEPLRGKLNEVITVCRDLPYEKLGEYIDQMVRESSSGERSVRRRVYSVGGCLILDVQGCTKESVTKAFREVAKAVTLDSTKGLELHKFDGQTEVPVVMRDRTGKASRIYVKKPVDMCKLNLMLNGYDEYVQV